MLHRQVEAGTLRRILKGVYTTNLTDDLEAVVARNLWRIIDLLVPGAVVACRAAFEMRPAKGRVYLVGRGRNEIDLPGLENGSSKGPGHSRATHHTSPTCTSPRGRGRCSSASSRQALVEAPPAGSIVPPSKSTSIASCG